jgi:hypothetical protein
MIHYIYYVWPSFFTMKDYIWMAIFSKVVRLQHNWVAVLINPLQMAAEILSCIGQSDLWWRNRGCTSFANVTIFGNAQWQLFHFYSLSGTHFCVYEHKVTQVYTIYMCFDPPRSFVQLFQHAVNNKSCQDA